ncbi:MAG TPA: Mur ligase family protein, partial [Spirochaetia bacterium]|nr:Mur ligase family protein [Spirochaetia bacterium]
MAEAYRFPQSLRGFRVHLVGIKGTGMAALAEILSARGARISGSDTAETFYTDAVLKRLRIPYVEGFAASNLPADAEVVIHSAAYRREDNPELRAAADRGLPSLIYPEALGALSAAADSSAVSGVHGKSTTTALCGTILKEWASPATVLVGAEVPGFGNRSTLVQGDRFLVAETCEYRRHFLNFRPTRIVITSVEPDHLDYFRDIQDILSAFCEFGELLPRDGTLIYCGDDPGARTAAGLIAGKRPDLEQVAYGRTVSGPFQIVLEEALPGLARFRLRGVDVPFELQVPGDHNVLNAAAALALCSHLWRKEHAASGPEPDWLAASRALGSFQGSRRRSEIVGEAG